MNRLLVALLVVLVFSMVALALDDQGNPNDPTINERANACYEGGSMDGKCDTDWEWEAGWYLIRFEYGLISREDFPLQYSVLLPPLPVEEAAAATEEPVSYPTANCVAVGYGGIVVMYANFNGGNFLPASVPLSDRSDCSNLSTSLSYNLVYAPGGTADALAICNAHGFNAFQNYTSMPLASDIYTCISV